MLKDVTRLEERIQKQAEEHERGIHGLINMCFLFLLFMFFYIYLFFQEIDTMKSDLALLKLQRQADHLKLGDLEVKMKHLEFENKKLKEGNYNHHKNIINSKY